jgi:DNA-binding transcriptional LysR family regulator
MNWKQLQFDWNKARAFLVVAKEGSLTAAGRALGISQPTLGRQISSLETELSLTLFERVGKGLMLTDAGQHLYQYVEKMAEAANEFALAAQGQNNDVAGKVCISLTELDAFFKLPDCIKTLRQVAPHIQLEVLVSNDISDLKRREADIAIRYQRPTQHDLIIKKIGTEKAFLYGHEDYVSHFKHAPIEKAAELNLIGFDHSTQMQTYLQQLGWPIKQEQFITLCKNQMVQLQLMRQGVGIGFLPDHIADQYPELMPVFANAFEPIELEVWLVCHTELHTNKKVRVVFDCLAEHFSIKGH